MFIINKVITFKFPTAFTVLQRNCSVLVPGRRRVRSKIDMDLKCRENPVVLKLETPEFKNMFSAEVLALKALFDKYEYEIRVAGGAVRDLLMGQQAKDLDFATTATPEQMKAMFTMEEVRLINMNGEKHGTITPRINDKENFEVTTLRIDMVTDGRHAEVQYTTDWKLDANRRDLTINSMFLGFDGSVYDYFFGYDDLLKKRIAFVGDPDVRIKEDYLRILRYFRFYGRIAEKPDNHEDSTLQIISGNVGGLEHVSGERIWTELKKILQGNFAGEIIQTMLHVGIGKYIGLPSQPDLEEFQRVMERGRHLNLHPMTMLAALLKNFDEVTVLHNRLKFSVFDRDLTYFIVQHREDKICHKPLFPYQKIVLRTKMKQKDIVEYTKEVIKYRGESQLLEAFEKWDIPKFPINGATLKKHGIPTGKLCGTIINRLKDVWAENDFKSTDEDLVKLIPDILNEFNVTKTNQRRDSS